MGGDTLKEANGSWGEAVRLLLFRAKGREHPPSQSLRGTGRVKGSDSLSALCSLLFALNMFNSFIHPILDGIRQIQIGEIDEKILVHEFVSGAFRISLWM